MCSSMLDAWDGRPRHIQQRGAAGWCSWPAAQPRRPDPRLRRRKGWTGLSLYLGSEPRLHQRRYVGQRDADWPVYMSPEAPRRHRPSLLQRRVHRRHGRSRPGSAFSTTPTRVGAARHDPRRARRPTPHSATLNTRLARRGQGSSRLVVAWSPRDDVLDPDGRCRTAAGHHGAARPRRVLGILRRAPASLVIACAGGELVSRGGDAFSLAVMAARVTSALASRR